MGKKRNALLRFDSALYPAKALKKAIRAYSELGDFKLTKVGRYFCVEINNIAPSQQTVISDEFKNYCLGTLL